MAKNHKKNKHAGHAKKHGKTRKHGFAQRTAEPSKKGGWMSAIGGVAKHLGGKVLDGIAMVQPELGPLRELVRQHYGFSERDATTSGSQQGGGAVVKVEDAPVAFARNPVKVGMDVLGQTAGGGQVVWLRDLVTGTLTTSVTPNNFSMTSKYLYPMESALFPNFYLEFQYWEKWRPLRAVLHYCHFAPTSVQTSVALNFSCSETTVESTLMGGAPTMSKFMGFESAVQGSCYEDFALVIEPESWKQGRWLGNYGSATEDSYDNYAGQIAWATDVNDTASRAVGYIYVELIFEVAGKRPAYTGVGLITEMALALKAVKDSAEYDAVVAYGLEKLKKLTIEDRKRFEEVQVKPTGYIKLALQAQEEDASFVPIPSHSGFSATSTAKPGFLSARLANVETPRTRQQ